MNISLFNIKHITIIGKILIEKYNINKPKKDIGFKWFFFEVIENVNSFKINNKNIKINLKIKKGVLFKKFNLNRHKSNKNVLNILKIKSKQLRITRLK